MKIIKLSKKYLYYVVLIIQKRWGYSYGDAFDNAMRWLKKVDNSICFIGIENKRPMATAVFDPKQEDIDSKISPWNTLLWVEPNYRGKGYGEMLTKKRFEYAKKLGYKTIYLDTTDAIEYHKRRGWNFVKHIKWNGEDDNIMKIDI